MAVDRQVTRASLINKASFSAKFAGETPAQIANHREIARRHQRRGNGNGCLFIPRLRIAELQRIFVMHYREKRLPDDDAGRADLRLMADHLAQIDPRLIRPWATTWMPAITPAELDALIASVGTGKRWKADALARELGLDDATRTRLRVRTIGAVDCGSAKRKTRRRRNRIAADRARRARAGARPHAYSAAATQPWIEEGISRRTWYRRRAKAVTAGTNSRPISRRDSIIEKNPSEGTGAVGTTDPETAHGGEAGTTFIAKPLASPSGRVRQSSDNAKIDPIAGLDDVAFRAVHQKHFQLLGVMPHSMEQKARLAALNEIIETERERRALRRSPMAAGRQGDIALRENDTMTSKNSRPKRKARSNEFA